MYKRQERDRYEEDPSKWPRSSGRTKATIHYEWTNVFLRNGVAYRAAIVVYDLLHHSRGPPKGPLSSTAPSGLVFTIDYAEALGEAVHEGIAFKGIIAYEFEAPTLLKQLPNGGVDCQDEKVYWTMPDGRRVSCGVTTLPRRTHTSPTSPLPRSLGTMLWANLKMTRPSKSIAWILVLSPSVAGS